MPTIYDILPTIEKKLLDLTKEYLEEDHRQIYTWDLIWVPAIKLFLHYFAGVNDSLEADNYVSTMANLRGLIEALSVVVYEGTSNLPNDAWDEFLKKGRLPKKNAKDKWVQIGLGEMVLHAQTKLGFKLRPVYDDCCRVLHFTNSQIGFLGGFEGSDEDITGRPIVIGSKDHIPPEIQRKIIDYSVELATHFGRYINAGIQERQQFSKRT